MAFPLIATVDTAFDTLLLIVEENPTSRASRELHQKILELAGRIGDYESATYSGLYAGIADKTLGA